MLQGFVQIALTLAIVVILTPLLGSYIAGVLMPKRTFLDPVMVPIERGIYALGGVRTEEAMTGWQYVRAVLYSNIAMGVLILFILMNQGWLPLNSTGLSAPAWDTATLPFLSLLTPTNNTTLVRLP